MNALLLNLEWETEGGEELGTGGSFCPARAVQYKMGLSC